MNSGLDIFDLAGAIMLVLAGSSFAYLLRIKNRSSSSQMLMWFFLAVILSALATIVANIGAAWDWAFAPAQDAFLIAGGFFLVRFAYLYPADDQPGEARWMAGVALLLALVALVYAAGFAIRYIAYLPGDLAENQAFYWLTPAAILFTVAVFFRRSLYCSRQDASGAAAPAVRLLLRPAGRPAAALQNYGLALSLGLVPVLAILLPALISNRLSTLLFNFGAVLAIAAVMLTYLNYAPEPVTLSAKLVGITLTGVLLVLGIAGVWVYEAIPSIPDSPLASIFIHLVLLSSLAIVIVFPRFYRVVLFDPLERLLELVRRVEEGDLSAQADAQYDDEIGRLTRSVNRMVRSLGELTGELEGRAATLAGEVEQHTAELTRSNELLTKENQDRQQAEDRLSRQLAYQQALAGCSQALLVPAASETVQQEILTRAMEFLRSAAQASRAYLIVRIDDDHLRILAETCASGIFAHIHNPINQRFPIDRFPQVLIEIIAAGRPQGGPVRRILAGAPELMNAFLTQENPLLSFIMFPVVSQGRWWGFVGFDDCQREREWSDWETALLGTAAEMIDNTVQRWALENRLKETLEQLEQRVAARTAELSQEIEQRQQVQEDLERRLLTEKQLAAISTRLQAPSGVRENIHAALADLAQVIDARRIFLAAFDPQAPGQVSEYVEWRQPGLPPLAGEQAAGQALAWLELQDSPPGETVYLEDAACFQLDLPEESQPPLEGSARQVVIQPLLIDQTVHGVLVCSDFQATAGALEMTLRTLELAAGMFKSLLQREFLIQALEEQVAERTRQLTTFLDMAMLSDRAQDLADVLQPALHSIAQIVACDACSIHIVAEKEAALRLIAQRGIPLARLNALAEIKIDAEFAALLKTPDFEIPGNPGCGQLLPEVLCIPEYQALVAAPLTTSGRSSGLLICYRLASLPFSPFQIALLKALGDLLGIIVENHRLRTEAEEFAALEERQRLAREIHDAISQSVYSLSLFARSAVDALDEGERDKLLSNLQAIETTALGAMREMRLLLYQLRETGQDEDLAAALETRFKQVENRLGIQTRSAIPAGLDLPSQARREVWRIIVEALNNVVKHAGASRVSVQIAAQADNLKVSIQDDGAGFDSRGSFPGMGLRNMQTRAAALAGQLTVASAPGQGTLVQLSIPMTAIDLEGDE
jgi:signal transduction histidine kinase/HAMP domain-containing protein